MSGLFYSVLGAAIVILLQVIGRVPSAIEANALRVEEINRAGRRVFRDQDALLRQELRDIDLNALRRGLQASGAHGRTRRDAIDRHTAILSDHVEDAEAQMLAIRASERLHHRAWRRFGRRSPPGMTLSNLRSTVIGGWETEFNTWNANKVPAEGFNEVFDAIQHMNREANGGDTARTNPTDAERLRTTIAAATRALIAALGSSPI